MKQLLKVTFFAAIVCLSIPATSHAQTVVSFNPPVMESPDVAQQFTIDVHVSHSTQPHSPMSASKMGTFLLDPSVRQRSPQSSQTVKSSSAQLY